MTNVLGTHVLLEAARERGLRYVQVSTDEVYGSIEPGSFTETLAAGAVQPLQRHQDRRRPARLQLLPHLRAADAVSRGSNNYGPAPVPREADPAVDPQRLRRRPAAGLRRRPQRAQLAPRRGLRPRHRARPGARRRRARSTTAAGPTSARTSRSSGGSSTLTGRRRVADRYVTDRPGHDRRYSLSSEKLQALGWRARTRFEEGLAAHRRLVPRQRLVVGADPLRRLPRVLRAPLRPSPEGLSDDARRGGDTRRHLRFACRSSASACCGRRPSSSPATGTRAPARSRSAAAPACRRPPSTSTSTTKRTACWPCSISPSASSRTRWPGCGRRTERRTRADQGRDVAPS